MRYFFPWTPIVISPIGIESFLSRSGLRVMTSEVRWVWLPALVLVVVARVLIRLGGWVRRAPRTEKTDRP